MWTYPAFCWPDEATGRAAIAAQGWDAGTPPEVDLLVIGAWSLSQEPAADGEDPPPPIPVPGWWVASAFRDRVPPSEWSAARAVLLDGMPRLGPDDLIGSYRAAIDAHVQATAQARSYNDAASCASYVTSTVPAWATEAAAFIAWRDAVYVAAFGALAAVQAGEMPAPTVEAFIASLPPMEWPA